MQAEQRTRCVCGGARRHSAPVGQCVPLRGCRRRARRPLSARGRPEQPPACARGGRRAQPRPPLHPLPGTQARSQAALGVASMSGARGTPHHIQAASGLGRSATVGTSGHAALILCRARHASARQPCSRLTASRAAARLPYVRVQLAQLRSHGRPGRAVDVPHMVHPQVVGHQHVPGARVRKRREQALL